MERFSNSNPASASVQGGIMSQRQYSLFFSPAWQNAACVSMSKLIIGQAQARGLRESGSVATPVGSPPIGNGTPSSRSSTLFTKGWLALR